MPAIYFPPGPEGGWKHWFKRNVTKIATNIKQRWRTPDVDMDYSQEELEAQLAAYGLPSSIDLWRLRQVMNSDERPLDGAAMDEIVARLPGRSRMEFMQTYAGVEEAVLAQMNDQTSTPLDLTAMFRGYWNAATASVPVISLQDLIRQSQEIWRSLQNRLEPVYIFWNTFRDILRDVVEVWNERPLDAINEGRNDDEVVYPQQISRWWWEDDVQYQVSRMVVDMYVGLLPRTRASFEVTDGKIVLQKTVPRGRMIILKRRLRVDDIRRCHIRYALERPVISRDDNGQVVTFYFYYIPCNCGNPNLGDLLEYENLQVVPHLVDLHSAYPPPLQVVPTAGNNNPSQNDGRSANYPGDIELNESDSFVAMRRAGAGEEVDHRPQSSTHQPPTDSQVDEPGPSTSRSAESPSPTYFMRHVPLTFLFPNGTERLINVRRTLRFDRIASNLANDMGLRPTQLRFAARGRPIFPNENSLDVGLNGDVPISCILVAETDHALHPNITIILQRDAMNRIPIRIRRSSTISQLASVTADLFFDAALYGHIHFYFQGNELGYHETIYDVGISDQDVIYLFVEPH